MKKFLYLAAATAVLASCSNELDVMENNVAKVEKGIVFSLDDQSTRGQYNYIAGQGAGADWYAELDRVNIYALNVTKGYPVSTPVLTDFSSCAVYKATQSGAAPVFTAVNDANILLWDDTKEADKKEFFAVYPTTATAAYTPAAGGAPAYFTVATPVATTTQKIKSPSVGAFDYKLMADYTFVENPEKSYDGVGQTAKLQFISPLSCIRTSLKDANKYTQSTLGGLMPSVFGKLKGIKVATSNAKWVSNSTPAPVESNISYATADFKYVDNTNAVDAWSVVNTTVAATSATLTWDAANAEEISDADNFYIHLLPVKRVDLPRASTTDTKTEKITVTYQFEHIDIDFESDEARDWQSNKMYKYEKSITEKPYLVTKGDNAAAPRTLIVNKGKLKKVLNNDGTKVLWNDEFSIDGEVDIDKIERIIVASGVDPFEENDWTALNKFSAATEVTIENSTPELVNVQGLTALETLTANKVKTVGTNAFSSTQGNNIKHLSLSDVTTYNSRVEFSKINYLDLNSYTFAEDKVAPLFFNDAEKTELQVAHLEALESMRPTFGYERTITFNGYTALEIMCLNPRKAVALPASCFNGTTSLDILSGIVEIKDAPNAFTGSNVSAVEVASTIIPNAAFQNAKTRSIIDHNTNKQIEPTKIGSQAFAGNTAIVNMYLDKVQSLGASAFDGATNFVGTDNEANHNNVVILNVTSVPNFAFKNTAVKRVQLNAATSVGSYAFEHSALKQIMFRTKVTSINATAFASVATGNVDLFVTGDQDDADGLSFLGLTWKSITFDGDVFPFQK